MGDAPKTLDAIVENIVSSPRFRSLITDVIENGQNNANQQTTRFATGQNANQQTTGLSTEQCSSGVQFSKHLLNQPQPRAQIGGEKHSLALLPSLIGPSRFKICK